MRGFQRLYSSNSLKVSYVILILIIIGIALYFVSMPQLKNEPATTAIQENTRTTEAITASPATFTPSIEAEHKLVMFTSITPMWEFSVPTGNYIASPDDGNIRILSDNSFLVATDEWVFVYILDISDSTTKIDTNIKDVKANQPIIQLNAGVLMFGVAKNCDTSKDIFLTCTFLDPSEYFQSRG